MSTYSRIVENITRKKIEKQSQKNTKESIAAHQKHLASVKDKIAKINAKIDTQSRKSNVNWGDVGSLKKVSDDLDEILKFLG